MPCHAMPCHAMPCHAMPCHAMPCHAMPRHVMLCHVTCACAGACVRCALLHSTGHNTALCPHSTAHGTIRHTLHA
jgi:hypothetical protein